MAAALSESVDVVVVGAGISGLSAAYELMKKRPKTRLVVLEAKDRVGGRLDSAELKTATGNDRWDVGGQWVARSQKNIMNLLQELDVEVYDQWTTGDRILQNINGNIKTYSSSLPPLSYLALFDMWWFFYKVDSMCKEVPIEDPTKCPHAELWDGMTLETWKQQTIWTRISIMKFIYSSFQSKVSESAESVKDTHCHYMKFKNLQTILGRHPMGGGGGKKNFIVGFCVFSCLQEDKHVFVSNSAGQTYKTKFVILAIPPHLTSQIDFTPELPYNKQRLTYNMPPAHLTKFVATYGTAFWRKDGLSGELLRSSCEDSCNNNPIAMTFDATTSDGNPAILGFITSSTAAKWSSVPDEIKREDILKSLKTYFGPEAEHPLDFRLKDWSKESWNGGCPVSVMVPGALTNYGDCLREPFLRIHWAGTESATEWRGYMDGAVQAGQRAANEVLARLNNPSPNDQIDSK
ncbi:unnamed protein product [Porites evermanni]|uniref:Amine oxidase n=1 Tax=Porites evermanni TaxID=104178 RepID=A0ABN8QY05_9CNID|nr:unnamed protein product [Porites evermanni]